MEDNTTDFSSPISLVNISSPYFALLWFEIIAAFITYGFGFIGNLLSLIIFFTQEEFRNASTGVLFIIITISNTVHLWTLTTEFLSTFSVYIYPDVFFRCHFHYFLQNLSRAVSTYIAIGTTFDRLIRSEYPIRSRIICTRRNAIKLALLCIFVFSILFGFWLYPFNQLNPLTGICIFNDSLAYIYFFNYVFLPLRIIFVCIIPIIIMSMGNIRMLYNIRQSRRRVQQGNEMNLTLAIVNPGLILRRMTPLDRMLFYMMVTSVGTFVFTQIPFHIYTVVQAYFAIYDLWSNLLIRALLLIWSSVYFGVGFYLYCLTSPLFREKFTIMRQKVINCF